MHNLYAALGIHAGITKHSRGVNCTLIQTVVCKIRYKLIPYTLQCFMGTSERAEASNRFKAIFIRGVHLYSPTVEKKCDNRNLHHSQLPELPSINGPNPAVCEVSSVKPLQAYHSATEQTVNC